MSDRVQQGGLQVAPILHQLVEREIAPGTGVTPEQFWGGLESIVNTLGPRNRELLQRREVLQAKIDTWHETNPGADYDRIGLQDFP